MLIMILYDLGENSLRLDAIHRVVGVSLVSRKVTHQKDRPTAPLAWRARIRRRTG